jgi:predicted  nucleic acid-binding Zn-ribbon protein
MTKRDTRINELEAQKDELSKRMNDLNASISNLETQIAATEKKLASSEGDRAFLLKELKRLQAEKAELEKQLNSLAFLREQVRKVKDELSISRRLDWIRRGLYGISGQKGGERLQQGFTAPVVQSNYNLNVELRQDGAVKVVPVVTNAPVKPAVTNKPAAK